MASAPNTSSENMATIAMSAFRTPAARGRAAIDIGGFQQLGGLLPLQ